MRAAVGRVVTLRPFRIDAWVVLPEHMHAVWTLPEGDGAYPQRWGTIKRLFSRSIVAEERRSASRVRQGERGIWQRQYWEHTIRDAADFSAHVDYVNFNAVKHGLVDEARDWPYSSFHRAVARGEYPADWGGGAQPDVAMGERDEAAA